MTHNNKAKIGVFALAMLMTGAVDGISNLPSIALFGQQLIFFFIAGSILFLFPVGLISAELCAQFKTESGVYFWTKKAFGAHVGCISIWLQWINTMIWFPTCLSTLTGTLAYLIDPKLIHSPIYLVASSLTVFWLMTLINLKGIKTSTKYGSRFSFFGMVVPICLVIGLGLLWLIIGKPTAITLNHTAILPHLFSGSTWTSLTAVITCFLGMELATVHVRKVHNAHSIFPKALIITIAVVIVAMGFGSLVVALTVPHQDITLVAGTVQAFNNIFEGFHIGWMEKVVGAMILFGTLGAMITWLISPAGGLAQAAKDGYLPKAMATENKHGVPVLTFLVQGVVVTGVSFAFFSMPTINGSYWLLLDLSTELYLLMYVIMFISSFKLLLGFDKMKIIPGGKKSALLLNCLGLVGCAVAFCVGFIPPSGVDVGGALHFDLFFAGGILLAVVPALILVGIKKYKS